MTDKTENLEEYNALVGRFIQLANEMRSNGKQGGVINAALMTASGIFATYLAAGNEGYLQPSGVDKVTDLYRRTLTNVQRSKQQAAQGAEPQSPAPLGAANDQD